MKCPNSSHSAGLNEYKPPAAVNVKDKVSNFPAVTMICYLCYIFFTIPATQSMLSVLQVSALVANFSGNYYNICLEAFTTRKFSKMFSGLQLHQVVQIN
jgi:hypothetical protein